MTTDFAHLAAKYVNGVESTQLQIFADRVGVSTSSLKDLGIGRDRDAWTFLERDADGQIIGIARRLDSGKKFMVHESKRGLTMKWPIDPYTGTGPDDPVLIVEGQTDTASGMDLEFATIGRPSATGGLKHLQALTRDRHIVIVADNDDVGHQGATAIADGLSDCAQSVKIIAPPQGAKDLREWKTAPAGCDRDEVLALIRSTDEHRPVLDAEVADGWSEPQPLFAGGEPPAFPIKKAFPPPLSPIRDYVLSVAEALQVPVDVPAMQFLSTGAVALAQKVEIELTPDWHEPSALWTLALLESGNRKSACHGKMLAPIHAWERDEAARLGPIIAGQTEERRINERRLEEFRKKASKPGKGAEEAQREAIELAQRLADEHWVSLPQVVTMEPTSEAVADLLVRNEERLLVASAEADSLDVMLGRYTKGTPNLGVYLSGHSGDRYRIDRKGREPDHLDRPALSMGLTVQPDAVSAMFSHRGARARGLIARFLISCPQSLLGRRKIDPDPIPANLSEEYVRMIRQVLELDIGKKPVVVRLDDAARSMFRELQVRIEPELGRDGELAGHGAWGGKLCGAVARIALVLHGLAEWGICAHSANCALEIGAKTMSAALAWAPYLIEHARIAVGVVGCPLEVAIADRVLKWLEGQEKGNFSRRDAFTECRSEDVQRVGDIDPALELLTELGYIRPMMKLNTEGPGRKPSPRYEFNPLWGKDKKDE